MLGVFDPVRTSDRLRVCWCEPEPDAEVDAIDRRPRSGVRAASTMSAVPKGGGECITTTLTSSGGRLLRAETHFSLIGRGKVASNWSNVFKVVVSRVEIGLASASSPFGLRIVVRSTG